MKNFFDQEPYARRGESDARLADLDAEIVGVDTRLDALEADTGWIEVDTFLNSWVNYGAGYPTAAYRKIGHIVYLKGLLKNGTMRWSAFTLPAGYRPSSTGRHFVTMVSAAAGGLRILNNGDVFFGDPDGGGNGYCSLDGIHFEVDG